jgi:hypothetical protein
MSCTSVITMRRETITGYWVVAMDSKVIFCCLTPEMALRIACLTRHAAGLRAS